MADPWKVPVAVVLVGSLVAAPLLGEDLPHAEFAAPGNLSSVAASGGQFTSNVSAQIVTVQRADYQLSPSSLEWFKPHDHLVVQTTELAPATDSVITTASIPRTGADPFHQRRQRAATPKLPPFWVNSQMFRCRRST
jgi:hypothetical protein